MNKKMLVEARKLSDAQLREALMRHDLTFPEAEVVRQVLAERKQKLMRDLGYGKKKPPQWTQN